MRQTSLMAYESIQKELSARQELVYHTISRYGAVSDKQLAKWLGWPINCVTPRRNELVKLGRVRECDVVIQDKRRVYLWEVTSG